MVSFEGFREISRLQAARKERRDTIFGGRTKRKDPDVRDMRETKRDGKRHGAGRNVVLRILTETAGLTLGLEQAKDVIDLDCCVQKLRQHASSSNLGAPPKFLY